MFKRPDLIDFFNYHVLQYSERYILFTQLAYKFYTIFIKTATLFLVLP
jgi:hypothetical protein